MDGTRHAGSGAVQRTSTLAGDVCEETAATQPLDSRRWIVGEVAPSLRSLASLPIAATATSGEDRDWPRKPAGAH